MDNQIASADAQESWPYQNLNERLIGGNGCVNRAIGTPGAMVVPRTVYQQSA